MRAMHRTVTLLLLGLVTACSGGQSGTISGGEGCEWIEDRMVALDERTSHGIANDGLNQFEQSLMQDSGGAQFHLEWLGPGLDDSTTTVHVQVVDHAPYAILKMSYDTDCERLTLGVTLRMTTDDGRLADDVPGTIGISSGRAWEGELTGHAFEQSTIRDTLLGAMLDEGSPDQWLGFELLVPEAPNPVSGGIWQWDSATRSDRLARVGK